MAFKAVILGLVVLAIHGQFIAQARPAGEEAKAEAPVEKAAGPVAEKAADAGELEAKNPAKDAAEAANPLGALNDLVSAPVEALAAIPNTLTGLLSGQKAEGEAANPLSGLTDALQKANPLNALSGLIPGGQGGAAEGGPLNVFAALPEANPEAGEAAANASKDAANPLNALPGAAAGQNNPLSMLTGLLGGGSQAGGSNPLSSLLGLIPGAGNQDGGNPLSALTGMLTGAQGNAPNTFAGAAQPAAGGEAAASPLSSFANIPQGIMSTLLQGLNPGGNQKEGKQPFQGLFG
jgi:hypothetical protein